MKIIPLCTGVTLIAIATAHAQLTVAQRCEKLKDAVAAKRVLCTAKQRGNEIAGKPFDYAACSVTMATKFGIVENAAVNHGAPVRRPVTRRKSRRASMPCSIPATPFRRRSRESASSTTGTAR
jgi:hypothetical protein